MQKDDCAAYIKLETKGSDPDTSFLEGLDLGVDVRTYMPVHWKTRAVPPARVDIYFSARSRPEELHTV